MELTERRIRIGTLLFLGVATVLVFLPLMGQGFSIYDDRVYVTANRMVQGGLTPKTIAWAFTTTHGSNWHPLTWISHQLDLQLFGLQPGWHHMSSLFLHVVNALLLCMVLFRMTGSFWPALLAAALFALHPLHVESVAWVSARKDLLSTFFWLLAMGAYHGYATQRTLSRYLLTTLCFACGLLAKPMVVTLPFVFLLLDYWPLGRMGTGPAIRTSIRALIPEKIPWFAMALISSVITYRSQATSRHFAAWLQLTPMENLANMVTAPMAYLRKVLLPVDLAVVYPLHPGSISLVVPVISLILMLLVTVCALRAGKQYPALLVGWFWYLVTLVPVVGIVRIGIQSMADRYTYLPLIGIFMALGWGGTAVVERFRVKRQLVVIFFLLVITPCALASRQQLGYWQDDVTLFRHAVEVVPDNWYAYNELSAILLDQGESGKALECADKAIALRPTYHLAHVNRGAALLNSDDLNGAEVSLTEALRLDPDYYGTYYNLGLLALYRKDAAGIERAFGKLKVLSPEHARMLRKTVNESLAIP